MSHTDDDLLAQVLKLHKHYNQIAIVQQGLPSRRPRHSNYAQQEQVVHDKAQEVIGAARSIACSGTALEKDVENIISGCHEIMNNPYKRLGGTVTHIGGHRL